MANIEQIKLYTVDHDYGVNPNPFYGYCTIGHCKPVIRRTVARYVLTQNPNGKAEDLGIWLVGIASGKNLRFKRDCGGKVLYVMQVTEVLSFKDYWNDLRFINKRSNVPIKYKEDNLDFRNCNDNIKSDVTVDCSGKAITGKDEYVLISDNFVYWGNACDENLGHKVYGSGTGGGRNAIYYPEHFERMGCVKDFIDKIFCETKRTDILGRPIMSAADFNLDEAIKAEGSQ